LKAGTRTGVAEAGPTADLPTQPTNEASALDALDAAAASAGAEPVDREAADTLALTSTVANRRRGRRSAMQDEIALATLLEVDGDWRWRLGPAVPRRAGRRSRVGAVDGRIVKQYRFERVGVNRIGEMLEERDRALTPRAGLRVLERRTTAPRGDADPRDGEWLRVEASSSLVETIRGEPSAWWRLAQASSFPTKAKRILLLVHGTFSEGDMYLREILAAPDGRGERFLARAMAQYDGHVYAFDHPTLSVTPLVNAVDLARTIGAFDGEIDVIAHSRGGLVARWTFDVLRPDLKSRMVLAGSPLSGTTLASPARVRAGLDALANFGKALHFAGNALAPGILAAPLTILRVVNAATDALARVPLFDAGVALVPGINAQSAVTNNAEIRRLLTLPDPASGRYAVLRANFESERVGWRFWRLFRPSRLAERMKDLGADIIFPGDNDLVVDTASMGAFARDERDVGRTPKSVRVHDFGTSDVVHHCAYFRQIETLDLVEGHFGWS